jgi:hypothetical protein
MALDGGAYWSVDWVSNGTVGQYFTNFNAMTSELVNFLYQ